MATIQKLKNSAEACLSKKADIPMSPLYNMAKVAKLESTEDLKYIQDAVNYLTCKACLY